MPSYNNHVVSSDSESDDYEEVLTRNTAADSEIDETSQDLTQSQRDDYCREDNEIQIGQYSKVRTEMDVLVGKLLSRWWYVLPDWPPANYNYREQLEKHMLKCYPVPEFEDHENVDSNGYTKCYQLSAFPGVFRDFKGIAHDLRPIEGKPCYNNLIQKPRDELIRLIKAAIKKQIELLSKSPYDESAYIERLQEELSELK